MTDTRSDLLDFAEQAARARGFDGFSYADLAKAIGIRKSSIHYHFPTKAHLSAALMDRYHVTLRERCTQLDKTQSKAADRLLGLIAIYRDALGDGKTLCLCVSFIASRESLSGDVIEKIAAFRHMMTNWINTVFELGAEDGSILSVSNPSREAKAALALLEGAHLAARASEDVSVFDEAVETLKLRLT